jgi:hypothetical protein
VSNASAKFTWDDFFRDVNRLTVTAVVYWSGILAIAVGLIVGWLDGGPDNPVYALMVTAWTWVLGPGVAIPVLLRVPPRWFRVPAGERVLHRVLGVGVFGWLLRHSGYNRRLVHPMWGFSINRAGLPLRALAAKGGASAHGTSFAIHIVLAALALLTGHPRGAPWILLPGVVLHLYPVLLQRAMLLRLQPLLDQLAAKPLASATHSN